MRTVSVIAWALIFGGAAVGVLIALALLGLAIGGHRPVPDPPYLKTVLLVLMGACGLVVVFGQSLRKQKAWAWDATMVLLVMASMVAGMPPLWMLDAGRRGTELITPFACSAVAVFAVASAMKVCVSGPVRAGFLSSASVINGLVLPAGVRVIAAIQWLSAVVYMLEIRGSVKTLLFGYPLHGAWRTVYYAVLALFAILVASGLYRMKEMARRGAMVLVLLTFLDSAVWAIVTPTLHGGFSWVRLGTLTWCLLMSMVTIWYLITRRQRFRHDTASRRQLDGPGKHFREG